MKNKILFLIVGILLVTSMIGFASAIASYSVKPYQCNYQRTYISMDTAAKYALNAGFNQNNAIIIVAISWAESAGGNIYACLYNPGSRPSWDRGILQINSYWHSEVSNAKAFDPQLAFKEAYRITGGSSFSQWVAYTKGTYKSYINSATAAVNRVFQQQYSCTNQCSSGQTRCNGYNKQTCVYSNGCYVWGGDSYCQYGCSNSNCNGPPCTPKTCSQIGKTCGVWDNGCQKSIDCGSCASGKTCSNGICITNTPSCTNQCSSGQTRCNGYNKQTCVYSNGCYVWGGDLTCIYGCAYNQCVNAPVCIPKTCSQLGKTCGAWDNGCSQSINCGSCSSGQTCNNGACVNNAPSCTNQCSSGQTRCNGQNSEACRDDNGDGCFEWAIVNYCSNGCYGAGICMLCVPNSKYCSENSAMVCNSDGTGASGIFCSYYGKTCSNGICITNTPISTDSGWKSPTSTGNYYNPWHNPSSAYISDNQYAWRTYTDHNMYYDLQDYGNFGFNIPAGSVINGIEIQVEGYIDNNAPSNAVRVSYSGHNGNQKSMPITTSKTTLVFGGPTDLWGATWSAADFVDSKFLPEFVLYASDTASKMYIDSISAKVYYR